MTDSVEGENWLDPSREHVYCDGSVHSARTDNRTDQDKSTQLDRPRWPRAMTTFMHSTPEYSNALSVPRWGRVAQAPPNRG